MRRIYGPNGPLLHNKNLGRDYAAQAEKKENARRWRAFATDTQAADAEALAKAEAKRARKRAKALRIVAGGTLGEHEGAGQ